ncbi:MAG: SDR family NAD(P)-dependent oxidoreductase [Actinobacteria bacterium]|jgi:NAD(P)-dependent dehydrogenase (short-subunit alcohol dehydrogenase family)|nr:MAG: SDR family NAD(P)-dependent oxidoreductase [Actinomycetota bacterium]
MRFKYEKTAVVTGAALGIGREICLALAAEGWKLGIVDINMEAAEETRELVERAGGVGEIFRCDVADPEQVAACADHFFATWGKVGLLVNNAGVMVAGCIEDVSVEDWRRIVDINLLGVVYGCRAFVPGMKKQGGGHIVNVASMAGVTALFEQAPYNTTKAAVIGLSETLRAELSPGNIRVTVACPLCLNTHLMETACINSDFISEFYCNTFAQARMSAPDIARCILKAVEKNRFYEMPQPFAKVLWLNKRLTPEQFVNMFYWLNRWSLGKPFVMWLARHGMV